MAAASNGVRALSQGDLPALLELTRDRGWKTGDAMWRLVLEAGDGFGIDAPDGRLAGAVVLTRYPPGLAVIGMLLVASRHGRRGLGRALTRHALAQVPRARPSARQPGSGHGLPRPGAPRSPGSALRSCGTSAGLTSSQRRIALGFSRGCD